jgi:hypothetical protein
MNTVEDNTCFRRPRTPGPTTPVKRGRGRNLKPQSVESPYFSPSKERPPRPNDENFLQTKTDRTVTASAYTDRSLNSPHNCAESDEATQTRIPANVSGLYRHLALCKPYLIQGVLFLS